MRSRNLFIPLVLAVCLSVTLATAGETEANVEGVTDNFQASLDHYAAGRFELSLDSAEAALDQSRWHVAIAYNNICAAQMKLGALELAADACSEALEIAPDYDRAWSNLAWVYAQQAELNPTTGAFLNLSVARYWQGAIGQSIAAAESALKLDPGSAIAHNNICAAHAKDGEWKRAVTECKLALSIDPDYPLAKNNLEWATTRTTADLD